MAMINAWSSGKKPWSYGEEATSQIREVFELRLQLLPYLYTAFANYHQNGVPPFRAMILEGGYTEKEEIVQGVLDSEKNPYAESIKISRDDQFMMGPDILVAPYYERQSSERKVLLPKGAWYDFHTGKLVSSYGGDEIIVKGDKTPLFVKSGAIIPMVSKKIKNTKELYHSELELRVYGQLNKNSEVVIYEDDGTSFDYQKGVYQHRKIQVEQSGTIKEAIQGEGPSLYGKVSKVLFMTESDQETSE